MFRENRIADKAQIESDDVAAVRVRKTGERDIKARKTSIEDLRALRSVAEKLAKCFGNSSGRPYAFPKPLCNDQGMGEISEIQEGCNSYSRDKIRL